MNDLLERVSAALLPLLAANSTVLTGLSGGVDSVVLLHILHRLAPRHSFSLSALHVHHGISSNADDWADFCKALCEDCSIPLHIEKVDIAPLRSHGIEAAARKLRHSAFAARGCDFVALAHHADDQAETLLLQLLRGAGVRGASAMPLISAPGVLNAGACSVIRPLLRCTRQEILSYARAHQLRWIEDESNADDNYPRNFLRHQLLPLLQQKFPAYRSTLSRSALHFAEASQLLDELASADAALFMQGGTLAVAALQDLTPPRARNLLRFYLHQSGAAMPQAVQLDDMLQQLCSARLDANVCVAYGHWQVRRYHGKVHVLQALCEFDRLVSLPWQNEAVLEWAALNARLVFTQTQGAGISLAKLRQGKVVLRTRCGGETMRAHLHAATRSLRNLLQEQHVLPWLRDRLPLLYCNEELVCVVGVAIAAKYQATEEEAGISVLWEASEC
jgi:tRNA(Ile)-lysidine synthase